MELIKYVEDADGNTFSPGDFIVINDLDYDIQTIELYPEWVVFRNEAGQDIYQINIAYIKGIQLFTGVSKI